jgi:PAS domain-containing protein
MELAIWGRGFHHDLTMRFATEIQADERAQTYRAAQPTAHPCHEILTDSAGRSNEVSQYLALAAQATNDAVRVWSVATGELSWPQGLEALLGFSPSSSTSTIGFWQKQLHLQDRARAGTAIHEALAGDSDHWTGEYRLRHSNGEYLHILERAYIVRNSSARS